MKSFTDFHQQLLSDCKAKDACKPQFNILASATNIKKVDKVLGRNIYWVVKNIPQYITPEVVMAAVKQNGYALDYVPEEYITPEVVLAAVQQDGWALDYVPEEYITPEVVLAAVQQDGCSLQFVPKKYITPEVVMAAVQQNRLALMFVPEKYKPMAQDFLKTKN